MAERRSTNAALRALQAQEAAWRAKDEERARRYIDPSKIKVRNTDSLLLGVNVPRGGRRNLNVRVKPQAQISAPRIATPDRAIMAVDRFSPALGSAVREADDFLGISDLWRSGVRSAADALGSDVYAGNEDLQYDDRQNLLLNAALTVAGGPLAKGAGRLGGSIAKGAERLGGAALRRLPAGARQGASDLAARGASWLRENAPLLSRGVSAPLRDADYVEGVFRDLPEEMGALPASSRGRQTFFPDEADWELPADLLEDPVSVSAPAIISPRDPVSGWHGTPHVFAAEREVLTPSGERSFVVGAPDVLPDAPADFAIMRDFPLGRFRSEKLGSGEGAQQYGIGTYIAENPEVARNYRSELTQDVGEPMVGDVPLTEMYERMMRRADAAKPAEAEALYDRLSALEDLGLSGDVLGVLENAQRGAYSSPETLSWFQQNIVPKYKAPGALYRVSSDLDARDLLDWDAPLAEQGDVVRRAVANLDLGHMREGNRGRVMLERFLAGQEQPEYRATGQMLLSALPHGKDFEHTLAGSQYLLGQGIPGVRYWDEGSREARRGTRNFVLFDPERDLRIEERYKRGGLAVKRKAR